MRGSKRNPIFHPAFCNFIAASSLLDIAGSHENHNDNINFNNTTLIDINKSNEIINAEGAVEVIDSLNNIINSQRIKYDKIKQILNTYGETEILTSEKFKIKGKSS